MANKAVSVDHPLPAGTESLAEAVIESAIDGIITIDDRGIVRSFNAAAERLFGYTKAEAIGRNISFLMPSPHQERHDAYIERYLSSREPRIIGTGRNVVGLHKSGAALPIRLALAEYRERGHTMFIGFVHDLAEVDQARREAEEYLEMLAHRNRVNAMGEMAAGLAHELRQPLMAIQAHASAVRTKCGSAGEPDEELCSSLDEIVSQSQRANDIIREMQSFLKHDQCPKHEAVDLVTIANNVLTLLSHELEAANIRFELDTRRPPCHCLVNRVQIEQVLYNLIRNAIDALRESPGEKRLRLSCERQEGSSRCVVTVQDNGQGIPEKHMDRLWDPFFTTKTHGMGQGLAICRSIVQHHGGVVSADNAADGGAVIRFTLPLAAEA